MEIFWGPDNHQQCRLVSLSQQSPAIQKHQWSPMSSRRLPMPAARFGGWSGASSCHKAQMKASQWNKWNASLWSSPLPLLQQRPGKSRVAAGLLERPDPLGGRGMLMNDCGLITMSNLLPVINSCSCMCFQHKTGEQIPACLILQSVLGLDGAQLLPGMLLLAPRMTQRIPCSGQRSQQPCKSTSGSTLTCPSYWENEVPRWILAASVYHIWRYNTPSDRPPEF